MVDAVVSYVVQRLGDFLIKEAVFLHGVEDEVQWLKDELRCMQRFMKDAEENHYGDAMIRGWVSDIRELAYDIEDLLDISYLKVQNLPRCFLSDCSCMFNVGNLYNIGKKIEGFKNRVNDLSRRRQLYGLQDSGNSREEKLISSALGRLREIRRISSFAVEQNVVGFEDDADELLTKLLDDDPRRWVISIYGMGGLGKTTLAGKLYHNGDVRKRFKYHAWVSVSQDYTTRDLLQRIIKSFEFKATKKLSSQSKKERSIEEEIAELEKLEKMNDEDLGRYLHKLLQDHSYVVVIDDVWDKEAWATLKRVFADNENGSRVIITTRNKEVAERSDEKTRAHKLRFLRPDESWQLFCAKTAGTMDMDEGLKKLGEEMVQKCRGLPLAIIVLAGLLSTRKPQEWLVVRNHIWEHLKNDSVEISSLLTLSFDYLPYQLKQCFLYLGVFPEDLEISMEELVSLFVAEGFIPQDENCIMEEVAKHYLDELVKRSLLQVDRKRWGWIATYRVHDLLRDLAVEKAKEMNFLCIYDEDKHSNVSSLISSCSRQAVYSKIKTLSWLEQCNPRLRSLFLFDEEQQLAPAMCRKFKSIRVLNVGYVKRETMVKEIQKLFHLKYLKLQGKYLDLSSLPLSNLQRLQTLNVHGTSHGVKLPAEIGKLQELRHLIGNFSNVPPSIESLEKLQTLKWLNMKTSIEIKTEKLVNLRELRINDYMKEGEFSFDLAAKLNSLQILSVMLYHDKLNFGSIQPLSHCLHLIELRLEGKLEKLPENVHEFLPNLQSLSLKRSHLKNDPLPLLGKLPNLIVLDLEERFYSGKKLICSANGFVRLEILLFDLNYQVQELQLEEGALPRLTVMRIPNNCNLVVPLSMKLRIRKTLA